MGVGDDKAQHGDVVINSVIATLGYDSIRIECSLLKGKLIGTLHREPRVNLVDGVQIHSVDIRCGIALRVP